MASPTPLWVPYASGVVVFSVAWEALCRYLAAGKKKTEDDKNTVPNPFMSLRPANYYHMRYLWPGLVLVPFRLVAVVILFLMMSLCGWVSCIGRGRDEKPLTGWRRVVMGFGSRVCARLVLTFLGFHWIDVKGAAHPDAKIIVGNHRGPFEAIYLMAAHRCCLVSAVENRFPVVKHAMDGLQFIFVDRSAKAGKSSVIDTIKKRASEPGWPAVALFPEGTTTNGRALIGFKRGAFLPGVPVQPVAFEFPNSDVDVDPSWVFGVRGPMFGLLTIVIRLMASWSNPMKVTYLPLAVPNEDEKNDAQIFANRVRADMGKVLNIPCTEHEQEDAVLAMAALKSNLPPSEGVLEFGKVRRLFNLTVPDVKKLLSDFKNVDVDRNGEVSVEDVGKLLGLAPDGEVIKGLFAVLNQGRGDSINFKEFVFGMAKASSSLSPSEKASLCFDAFDLSQDGILSEGELHAMLKLGFSHTTPKQTSDLFTQMSSSGPVTKSVFARFLEEHPAYLYLFDLLRQQADEPESPLVSTARHSSFTRHRAAFVGAGGE